MDEVLTKLKRYREQYTILLRVGEEFLALSEPDMDAVEHLILTRERCVLTMRQEPLLSLEKNHWRPLAAGDMDALPPQEREIAEAYREVEAMNHRVVSQDQVLNMRLRGLQQKYADTPDPDHTRKIEDYAEVKHGDTVGLHYDRLR
jgi:hypothetical protein